MSGDGGIRTRVPRRANAFRVRPVMTTSIRLQRKYLISISHFCEFARWRMQTIWKIHALLLREFDS